MSDLYTSNAIFQSLVHSGRGVIKHIFLCRIENTWVYLAAVRKPPRVHSRLSAHQQSGM